MTGAMFSTTTAGAPERAPAILPLLLRTNLLQAWRRLRAVRQQSRLLSSLIGLFVLGYVALAFWLFSRGLLFVATFPGLGLMLIERLMYLLFAFLFVLLMFSNVVIGYVNLFRNREAAFLLTLPVDAQVVFRWKLLESTLLASWAFLFLVAPLLAAFGWRAGVPWHFYLITPLLVGLFIVLPGVAGAWGAIQLARFLDRRTFQVWALILVLALAAGAVFWLRAPVTMTDDALETRVLVVLDRLMAKTSFSQFPFLPSFWLSTSVLNWAEGAVAGAMLFILVLLSYVLLFGALACTHTGRIFYEGISAVHSRGSVLWQWRWFQAWRRRRAALPGRGLLERLVDWLRFLPADVRGLAGKDLRVFWRDTTQWGQTLVLFGLLAAYIVNLRHFSRQFSNPFWIHLVSYLNLGACALNLATLTTRFVFPQLSLEGKRMWIVGMAPLGLQRVLWTKFGMASAASLLVTLALMLLSCSMLQMPSLRTAYFAAAIAAMTFALNGLAVGLGAMYPNFREDNPGKIVSGFGGTLCLVLSFVYILLSIVVLAAGTPWSWSSTQPPDPARVLTCLLGFLILSGLVGWLPLRFGFRRLRQFEF